MALSAFGDKSHEPGSDELADVLLEAAGLWEELISGIGSEFDPLAKDYVGALTRATEAVNEPA